MFHPRGSTSVRPYLHSRCQGKTPRNRRYNRLAASVGRRLRLLPERLGPVGTSNVRPGMVDSGNTSGKAAWRAAVYDCYRSGLGTGILRPGMSDSGNTAVTLYSTSLDPLEQIAGRSKRISRTRFSTVHPGGSTCSSARGPDPGPAQEPGPVNQRFHSLERNDEI